MLSSITDTITQAMLKAFHYPELVTVLVAILPIVEARGAVPFAINMGIKPVLAGLYSFLGSSVMAPILIAAFLPLVKWMMRTKGFKKIGETIYEKFEKKSQSVMKDSEEAESPQEPTPEAETGEPVKKKKKLSADGKKMLGVFAFVAIPLPLTGVWTGSAVAAITRLPFHKALIAVLSGNLVANVILTLLFALLAPYKVGNISIIDLIIVAIGVIAIVTVLVLIIKIIVHKPTANKDDGGTSEP